jgi:hypothetical protein
MTIDYGTARHFSYGVSPFTPLQQAIIKNTKYGTLNYKLYEPAEITAPLQSISSAVEYAFVLVEKASLPRVTHATNTLSRRMFTFAGDPFVPYSTDPNHTSEQARKTAAKWLAIAGFLEDEEKDAAAEAKKKADAEKASEGARMSRLSALAGEYFDSYFTDLGPKKTRVIEELYDLQEKLKTDGEAA